MSRVFTNGLGDQGSIPSQIIPKTQKIVLDATLLNTRYYKVEIKSKVKQSREWSCTLPFTLVYQLMKRQLSGHPQLRSTTLLFLIGTFDII